ncbi:TonB-dependent receptor [Zoogloea sp.]|uniref:TonB-dependent receptor n=1 Tax=Zoogloea sp. TaxID=49181 RepID=UPI00260C72F6|nr:TonB-dependent receptor [Zoogloea sp.]
MTIRRSAAAIAVAAALSAPALAADVQPEVVVTASRFDDTGSKAPVSLTRISRDDIARSGGASLPDVLGMAAGLDVRPMSGALGIDTIVDLRGFGEAAGSNTLILLDGQRLNPVDMSGIDWSAIPLQNVSRVEVMRGAGGVLFGDRSVGGVINIITDKSGAPRASAGLTLGSYGYHRVDVSASGSGDATYFNIFANYADVNGWRQNTRGDQRALSGRVGHVLGEEREVFIDVAAYGDSNGLPGSIKRADYDADATRARSLTDHQKREGYRVRPGVRYALTDTLTLEGEITYNSARQNAVYGGTPYIANRDTTAFTPRLQWRHGLGGLASTTVGGLDVFHGAVDNVALTQTGSQLSRAFYLQNTTSLRNDLHLTVGARRQIVRQHAEDRANGINGEATHARNAFEAGLAWDLDRSTRLFTRWGQVFRFSTTDELFGYDPLTYAPVFTGGNVRPQHGTNIEVGARYKTADLMLQGALYRLSLTDEIGYNPITYANENFDRTRREGVELEARWRAVRNLELNAGLTAQNARFVDGPNSGKDITLVPHLRYRVGAVFDAATAGRYGATWTHTGKRRFGGDFDNTKEMLDGYGILDLHADWKLRDVTLQLRLANATNQKYAPYALFSSFAGDYYFYPAEGRSLFGTVRYDFR